MPEFYYSQLEHSGRSNSYHAWFRHFAFIMAVLFPMGLFLVACGGTDSGSNNSGGGGSITVTGPGAVEIIDGGTYDFGYKGCWDAGYTVFVDCWDGAGTAILGTAIFTIQNNKTVDVVLNATPVMITDGADTGTEVDFAVSTVPGSTIPAGGSTTFSIDFVPVIFFEQRDDVLTIFSDDPDLNGMTFGLLGFGTQ